MHFTITDVRYTIAVSGSPVLVDGKESDARIDRVNRRILISHEVPRHDRRLRLFHELGHLFDDTEGTPDASDPEASAQNKAEFGDWLHEQYNAQGGDSVLEALNPEPEPAKVHGSLTELEYRRCGLCNAPIANGSIDNGLPMPGADGGSFAMDRGFPCDVCGCVNVWRERCTEAGEPTGVILAHPKPRVLRGREVSAWHAAREGAACR